MKKIKNIIILAGGDSDRFWPLKEKLLTPFLGKPLITHFIDGLSEYGEKIFVVCSEVNKALFEKQIGKKAQFIIQDKTKDGMAGATISCKGKIHGDTLIIGNDFFEFSAINDLIEKMRGATEFVFLAKKVNSYYPGGYLQLKNDKLTGVVEKPDPLHVPSDLVNLVVDYVKNLDDFIHILETINVETDDHYERAIHLLIQEEKVDYLSYKDYWWAFKYPWHVLSMMKHFLNNIKENKLPPATDLEIASTAIIQGPVILEKGVKVGHFAKITGPCYIGENTIIADYALVRESHIGKNCLIGSSCEVARSYLGDKVSLHRNYVGDSVLAEGVLFGSGAVTANFRFDENEVKSVVKEKKVNTNMKKLGAIIGKNTKMGVNSTLYPGVKIGSNRLIFPGEVVRKDIPDKQ